MDSMAGHPGAGVEIRGDACTENFFATYFFCCPCKGWQNLCFFKNIAAIRETHSCKKWQIFQKKFHEISQIFCPHIFHWPSLHTFHPSPGGLKQNVGTKIIVQLTEGEKSLSLCGSARRVQNVRTKIIFSSSTSWHILAPTSALWLFIIFL